MNKINFNAPLAIGLVGAGLLATGAPAQAVAIQYVFSGANFSAGPLTGNFFFDAAGPTLSPYNISVPGTGAASALTYTPLNSTASNVSSTGFLLTVLPGFLGTSSEGTVTGRTLEILFQTALGPIGSSTSLDVTGPLPQPRSQELLEINNGDDVVTRNVTSGSATGVPLETDALPVAATMAVVGGMLWHRNRKRSRVTLDLTPSAQTQKV